jgi:class 3 adenylate cyclase
MRRNRGGHVLATVVFTDIVDSSRLAAELGDSRWHALLVRHHAIVRSAIKRFHGTEIDNAGDGFFAAFRDQVDAIRCACAISDDVREIGIEVRAGCHAGQAEVLGKKLGGVTIHVAARVMSEATPGEVLVTGTLKDLVPASGFGFADRGVHSLKGIEGERHLYSVVSIDGAPRPPRLEPSEAARVRAAIRPATIVERRSGRVLIAAAVLVALAGTWFVATSREHRAPVRVRPNSLVRIDPRTEMVVADVGVAEPGYGQMTAVPPHEIWVLSHPEQIVSIIDAGTNTAAGSIPIGRGQANSGASGFGLVYAFGKAWVAPLEGNTVEAIDPVDHTVTKKISTLERTGRLAQGLGKLWIPIGVGNDWRVEAIDPRACGGNACDPSINAETGSEGYTIGVGEGAAWTSDPGEFAVSRVDPVTGRTSKITLPGLPNPSGIGFGFQSVWVADTWNGVVYRIDPATLEIIATVHVTAPDDISPFSDVVELDGSMWVSSPSLHSIERIDPDTNTVQSRISLPYEPEILLAAYGSLWVTVEGP